MKKVPVLIAGGGPVGLTLSLELARYGVESVVAERHPNTTTHPKMDLTNGRSMELLRRLGLADTLRAVGVPPENSFDISWITSLNGDELHRFPYPSAAEATRIRRACNDGSLTLEAPMRVSQIVVEPVLKRAAVAAPHVTVRAPWRLERFVQDADGVSSTLRHVETGEEQLVRSDYLVGCDGGGSTVRSGLGILNEGKTNVASMYMIHFRSEARELLQRFGITWHYQNGSGVLVAQNDWDTWTLHVFLPPGTDASALEPRTLVEQWVGCPFPFEVLVSNPWSAHYLVAEHYREGRVLLAGDAAHQFMPTGGYGMNSGVADAANLGWKLAALVQGWGGPALLDSYEAERRPVAMMSWATSEEHLKVRFALAELYAQAGELSGSTPEALARRSEAGRRVAALGNAENECWGTEHGYRYDVSPVVCAEAGTAPAFDPLRYTPSTWPGSRLPHVFLADGSAVYDQLGTQFTLLVLDESDTSALERAADQRRIPLAVLRIKDANAARIYQRKLILVRPDQHVAWRGDCVPDDSATWLAHAAGFAA
jgi:2-polyprenyl-6-methoxyphenol hydroxylase-like FAD-dependent oxidoreductase